MSAIGEWWSSISTGAKVVKSLAAVVVALTTIAVGIIGFDTRYAHAEDIQKIIGNQDATLKSLQKQQKQFILFQLEYYDSKLKTIEEQQRQLDAASARVSRQAADANAKAREEEARKSLTVQKEEVIQRKNFITRSLIE